MTVVAQVQSLAQDCMLHAAGVAQKRLEEERTTSVAIKIIAFWQIYIMKPKTPFIRGPIFLMYHQERKKHCQVNCNRPSTIRHTPILEMLKLGGAGLHLRLQGNMIVRKESTLKSLFEYNFVSRDSISFGCFMPYRLVSRPLQTPTVKGNRSRMGEAIFET